MVKLNAVQAANAALVQSRPLVVVSAGGTSGIGESTLRQLAKTAGEHGGKGLRIYIIGRREEAVKALIADLSKSYSAGEYIYIHGKDLSLLKGIDDVAQQITELEKKKAGEEARIDLLFTSQAIFTPFTPRKDTSEGLDINMALMYYSRMRLTDRLLPLLLARPSSGEPAHIVSVYAAGAEKMGTLYADDLSLRDPKHYSFSNVRSNIVHMKTMYFEHLAKDHPGKLSLVHVYPGLVITPAMALLTKPPLPWYIRWSAPVLLPIAKVTVATPVPESGQRTLFLTTERYPARSEAPRVKSQKITSGDIANGSDGVLGGGAYSCTVSGETTKPGDIYTNLEKQGFYEKVWNHTQDVFRTIESGKVFTD